MRNEVQSSSLKVEVKYRIFDSCSISKQKRAKGDWYRKIEPKFCIFGSLKNLGKDRQNA